MMQRSTQLLLFVFEVEEGGTTNQLQKLLSIIISIILGAVGLVLWVYAIMYCIGVGKKTR